MEEEKDKAAKKETSSASVIERGKKAIEANDKINKKDPDDPRVQEEKAKDAEQWRNEG